MSTEYSDTEFLSSDPGNASSRSSSESHVDRNRSSLRADAKKYLGSSFRKTTPNLLKSTVRSLSFKGKSAPATPMAKSGPLPMQGYDQFESEPIGLDHENSNPKLELPRSALVSAPKSGPVRVPSGVGEMMKRVRTLSRGSSMRSMSIDFTEAEGVTYDAAAGAGSYSNNEIMREPLIVLEFRNLTYEVHGKQELPGIMNDRSSVKPGQLPVTKGTETSATAKSRRLLNEVSGEARDGEILAVMGPSGSGKSTLIDALAQRIVPESLAGRVTLNGQEVSSNLLRSISAYVMQDDLLFPMLTVKETLMFAAEVRLPSSSHSGQQKRDRVGQLLLQLGLQRVADTIIGNEEIRGVSGGERRRVSIGIDIIHDPLLLFLDEPTSGLDSTSAYLVIKTLQKIALGGSIVILSIHQPSYRILGLLDRLIIIAAGQKVYGGSPAGLKPFFVGFGRPIPEHENSTEHALDLIQELQSTPEGIKPLVEFSMAWGDEPDDLESGLGLQNVIHARGKVAGTGGVDATDAGFETLAGLVKLDSSSPVVAKFANSFSREVWALLWRSLVNIRRTPSLFLTRVGTLLATGFMVATFFWRLDHSPEGVQERLNMFTYTVCAAFFICADALPVFLQERYILLRETAHNAYRKSSYVMAHSLIYIPFQAVLAIVFLSTIWWGVGLAGGVEGYVFLFTMLWAIFFAGTSFVTFLSTAVPNLIMGYIIVVSGLSYFQLVSGFFLTRDSIPRYWIWLHYLSLIKYPYEAVMINEFDRPGTCFIRGSDLLYGTPLAGFSDPGVIDQMLGVLRQSTNASYADLNPETCIFTGHDVLASQDIVAMSKWIHVGIVVAFGVVFRVFFYILLRLQGGNRRH